MGATKDQSGQRQVFRLAASTDTAYDQEQIDTEHRKATNEMRSRGLL